MAVKLKSFSPLVMIKYNSLNLSGEYHINGDVGFLYLDRVNKQRLFSIIIDNYH